MSTFGPQYKTGSDELQGAQRSLPKRSRTQSTCPPTARGWRSWELFSLKKKQLQWDLTAAHCCLRGSCWESRARVFKVVNDKIQQKSTQTRFQLDFWEKRTTKPFFYTVRQSGCENRPQGSCSLHAQRFLRPSWKELWATGSDPALSKRSNWRPPQVPTNLTTDKNKFSLKASIKQGHTLKEVDFPISRENRFSKTFKTNMKYILFKTLFLNLSNCRSNFWQPPKVILPWTIKKTYSTTVLK